MIERPQDQKDVTYYDSYTQMGGPEPLSYTHEAGTEMQPQLKLS